MSASLLTRNILKSSRMINNSVLCNIRMKSNTMITRTMASVSNLQNKKLVDQLQKLNIPFLDIYLIFTINYASF